MRAAAAGPFVATRPVLALVEIVRIMLAFVRSTRRPQLACPRPALAGTLRGGRVRADYAAAVDRVVLFGSRARCDWGAESDIDVLVRLPFKAARDSR